MTDRERDPEEINTTKNLSQTFHNNSNAGSQTQQPEILSEQQAYQPKLPITSQGTLLQEGDSSVNCFGNTVTSHSGPLPCYNSRSHPQYFPWGFRRDVGYNSCSSFQNSTLQPRNLHYPNIYPPPYANCSHPLSNIHPNHNSFTLPVRFSNWAVKCNAFGLQTNIDKPLNGGLGNKNNSSNNIENSNQTCNVALAFNGDGNGGLRGIFPVVAPHNFSSLKKCSTCYENHHRYHHHHHPHVQHTKHCDHHEISACRCFRCCDESQNYNSCHTKPCGCNITPQQTPSHDTESLSGDLYGKDTSDNDEVSEKLPPGSINSAVSTSTDDSSDEQKIQGTTLLSRLSTFHTNTIDEIISATARDVGLSSSEHAGLKMDLFRNYIRTYDALKDAMKSRQLHVIIHPFLAEVIIRKTEEFEAQLQLDEVFDAPETIPNVSHFRHGALFANRVILLNSSQGKIVCTYALDISTKSQVNYLFKKLAQIIGTELNMLRVVHDNHVLDAPFDQTLESCNISCGDSLDVFVLNDTMETKLSTVSILGLPSVKVPLDLSKVLFEAQKEFSKLSPLLTELAPFDLSGEAKETNHSSSPVRSKSNLLCLDEIRKTLDSSNETDFVPTMMAIEKLANTYGIHKNNLAPSREGLGRSTLYNRISKKQEN